MTKQAVRQAQRDYFLRHFSNSKPQTVNKITSSITSRARRASMPAHSSVGVLCDVRLERGYRTLSVKSAVEVDNQTDTAIQLSFAPTEEPGVCGLDRLPK